MAWRPRRACSGGRVDSRHPHAALARDVATRPDGFLGAGPARRSIDMRRGVVALRYRGIGETGPAQGTNDAVDLAELEAQLEVVAAAGGAMDPRRATTGDSGIVLTFDGAERSIATEALPRLARRGWVAALFVPTASIGRPGHLSAAELKRVRGAGWLVGSLGDTGRPLAALPPGELREEIARSSARLAKLLGERPAHLAFPGGRSTPPLEEEARAAGFTTLWSGSPGVNAAMLPRGPLRRTAVRRGEPLARFEKLVRGDPLAHAADRLDDAVRRAVGEARYDALAGRVLAALGRRRQPAIAASTSVGASTRTRSAGASPTRKPRDPPFT